MTMNKNLFATVLTYIAPSSNYRGEKEDTRTVLQKITKGNKEHTVVSPESMRNALREILIKFDPESCNRRRVYDQKELAVSFKEFPDAEKYADDFLFGYLVTNSEAKKNSNGKPLKRDSVLRMNMAVALLPYRPSDTIFFQSPKSPLSEAKNSGLLHREVSHTSYQYPFALAGGDCKVGKGHEWTRMLLNAIGQLSKVAGGNASSYYEMAPKSIVARLTPQLVAGFDTYGFDEHGKFAELARIKKDDLPGDEFWIGGEIVRAMSPDEKKRLEDEGAHLHENPQRLLAEFSDAFLGQEAK